jgi:hypothetical protein
LIFSESDIPLGEPAVGPRPAGVEDESGIGRPWSQPQVSQVSAAGVRSVVAPARRARGSGGGAARGGAARGGGAPR